MQHTSMMVYSSSVIGFVACENYSNSSVAWVLLNGQCQAYGRNVFMDVIH